MNENSPLTPQHAARLHLADLVEAARPRRRVLTVGFALTLFFRDNGYLPPHGRWVTQSADYQGNPERFALLSDTFGHQFAVAITARHTVAREGFIEWLRQYRTPEEKLLEARRTEVAVRKAQIEESTELRTASIQLQRDLKNSEAGAIRGRRQMFINYLRQRNGPCDPTRTYRRWRGYEEKWMRFTRARDHLYDPSMLPARGYHVRKDVLAVLGEAAVPLIVKAPKTTRDALATALEEIL